MDALCNYIWIDEDARTDDAAHDHHGRVKEADLAMKLGWVFGLHRFVPLYAIGAYFSQESAVARFCPGCGSDKKMVHEERFELPVFRLSTECFGR